jgi:hypothetical protein
MNPNTRKLVGVCGALVVAAAIALLVAFFAFPDSLKFGEDDSSSSSQNADVQTMGTSGALADAVAQGKVTKQPLAGYSSDSNVDGVYKGNSKEMDPVIQKLIIDETREQYLESVSAPKKSAAYVPANVEKAVLSDEDVQELSMSADKHGVVGKLVSKASEFERLNEDIFELKGQTACYPMNGDELYGAAMDSSCTVVVLQKSEEDYILPHDIVVTSRKVIVGHPIYKPTIDAGEALRAFTVKKGGFLTIKFVRISGGAGTVRPRGAPYSEAEFNRRKAQALNGINADAEYGDIEANGIYEIRGGDVKVELGGQANFIGVGFVSIDRDPAQIAGAIEETAALMGARVYGGHVLVAGGIVQFYGCHFWNSAIMGAFTDQVIYGGDVLVIAGEARFVGTVFTTTLLIGEAVGLGFNVAVFGGLANFIGGALTLTNIGAAAAGAGLCFFTGGGVMIMVGFAFQAFVGMLFFAGIGDFFVGGGVMILIGMSIVNYYGLVAAYGAGFYLAVGAGVIVTVGVPFIQSNGPHSLALAGGSVFLGSGSLSMTESPAVFAVTTGLYSTAGGFAYNFAGVSTFILSPNIFFSTLTMIVGQGGLYCQGLGAQPRTPAPTPAPTP